MMINASITKQPTEEEKGLFAKAMRALDLQLAVGEYWTDGRATPERCRKTNGGLGRIKDEVANGKLLNGEWERETPVVQWERRKGRCDEDTQ